MQIVSRIAPVVAATAIQATERTAGARDSTSPSQDGRDAARVAGPGGPGPAMARTMAEHDEASGLLGEVASRLQPILGRRAVGSFMHRSSLPAARRAAMPC